MLWQLRHPVYRQAIDELVGMAGSCALVGTTGVQVHVAATVGLERLGPPAHAIAVVRLAPVELPSRVGTVSVVSIDGQGFEPSIEAERVWLEVGGERFPVAAPEHVLGLQLATPELPPDAKWACFVLMRICQERLDLEQVRGLLKRGAPPERQTLLAELAYLAA